MKTRTLAGTLIVLSTAVSTKAATVIVDDFDAAGLNPMWTLHDDPASYASGGGFSVPGTGFARFDSINNEGYGHLSMTVDTTQGARADAIIRNDNYYSINWAGGVGFYFDANNWVSLKIGGAGGEIDGWNVVMLNNGVYSKTPLGSSPASYRFDWHVGGVELTDTSINFYASAIPPNPSGSNVGIGAAGIDSKVSLLLTIPRPAAFTGNADVIVGQGFTGSDASNPHLDNVGSSLISAFVGIDLVRITIVPEPATVGFMTLGGLAMLVRPRRMSA